MARVGKLGKKISLAIIILLVFFFVVSFSIVFADFNLGDSSNQIILQNNISGNQKTILNISYLSIGTTTNPNYRINIVGDVNINGTLHTQNVYSSSSSGGGGPVSAADISAGEFGANTGGGSYSFPAGLTVGKNLSANGDYAVIIGGEQSTSSGDYSGIFGGAFNIASGKESVILGGGANMSIGYSSLTIGGESIYARGSNTNIVGGNDNNIDSNSEKASILGGSRHNIISSSESLIFVGGTNNINTDNTVIIGSHYSSSSGAFSTIIGGDYNEIQNTQSAILGGLDNINKASSSVILNSGGMVLSNNSKKTLVFGYTDGNYTINNAGNMLLIDPANFGVNVGIGVQNPTEKLEVNGAILIGNTTSSNAGTIRYTGKKFQGYTGSSWSDFAYPSGAVIRVESTTSLEGWTYIGEESYGTNLWTTKANMPTGRDSMGTATVNNKIYVIGGYGSTTYLPTNEEYDPSTNTWTTKADMPTARYGLTAAAVNNKIYAIGGHQSSNSHLSTNEEYDPSTNTWTTKADMPTARRGMASAVVNGKIYVIGGEHWTGGQNEVVSTNEEYDPSTNTWTTKADMPTARYDLAAGTVGNKIYAIGGYYSTYLSTNEEYDPSTNTWTTKANMPTARTEAAAASCWGKIFVMGGTTSSGKTTANESYNPSTNTWTTETTLPEAVRYAQAESVYNKIYLIGGDNNSANSIQTTRELYPTVSYYTYQKN